MDRKDFLRKFGLGAGIALIAPKSSLLANHMGTAELEIDKQSFLFTYEQWLQNFQQFIEVRNQNPLDTENNLRLMELSKQAKAYKPLLEKYMMDPNFASYFDEITRKLSQNIK